MKNGKNRRFTAWITLLTLLLGLFSFAQAQESASIPEFSAYSNGRFTLVGETDYGVCVLKTYEAAMTAENKEALESVMSDYRGWFSGSDALTFGGDHHADFGRFGSYSQDACWFSFNASAGLDAFSMNLGDKQAESCHVLLAFKEYDDKFALDLYYSAGVELDENLTKTFVIPDFAAYAQGVLLGIDHSDGGLIIYRLDTERYDEILFEYAKLLERDYGFSSLTKGSHSGMNYVWFERHTEIPSEPLSNFDLDGTGCFVFAFANVDGEMLVCMFAADGIVMEDTGERYQTNLMIPLPASTAETNEPANEPVMVPVAESSSSASGRVLISEAASASDFTYTHSSDAAFMQDLVNYCAGRLSYDDLSSSGNHRVRDYKGSEGDLQLVKDYVSMLVSTHPYLTLKDSYWQSYDGTSFFSYAIDYTGNVNMGSQVKQTYADTMCDVMIYGTIERSRMELAVWTPADMELADLGYRYGGGQADVSIGGQSALAGLYKNADGSYETSDGRFRVFPGEAMILRDGQVYTTEATYAKDDDRDCIWMRYFYRNETLHFSYPPHSLMTGDTFRLKDFLQESSWLVKDRGMFEEEDDLVSYRWNGLFLGANHDGDWITPVNAPTSLFKDATVRVMYMDRELAVFYVYAEYTTAPYTVEALCAVPLQQTVTDSDADYITYAGQLLDVPFEGTHFGASYELFDWEIISGADLASLSNTQSKTCTLRAQKPGFVGLRVTYSYGAKEPDVLTGNMTNASHTKTQDYIIWIK